MISDSWIRTTRFMITRQDVEGLIGEPINDLNLYVTAFTHRSYLNEHRSFALPHNERLEFLGDAVLELSATEHLYKNYPFPEGELTNFRSALVNYKILSHIAGQMNFEKYLLMSKGEAKDTGRARQVILANAIEAFIGAIYLDLGFASADRFIQSRVLTKLTDIIDAGKVQDPKSKLQELIQDKKGVTPHYDVLSQTGPDHNKVFTVSAMMNEVELGRGEGPSKQEAEISAAEDALKKIDF